ncbi:hypothetical protein Q31b_25240 [Novipirellula aureliae]|uniref:Uncharacterized protein n=1 Tax=Novipirellula aureliae TaxID=2527966 RepID=A0A5C6E1F0_9BACT|nr:hypothetical protein [Novipirellula aureliae]TWU43483.1 hypothetical protein Q31b_25240 [Novipirellula aureliae]
MTTITSAIAQSHADHRYWQNDLDTWADDVANWKSEQSDALKELKKIADEIYEHGESLDEHNEKIATLASALHAHEKALAECLKSGIEGDMDADLNAHHEKQAVDHAHQREAHERIKKHHHQAMAQVAILRAAMEAAM